MRAWLCRPALTCCWCVDYGLALGPLHALHLHSLTGRDGPWQVDSSHEALAREPPTSPGVRAQPDGMCYIIFTSGSTGRPKGAVLQHAGVVNYLHCITTCALCLLPPAWSKCPRRGR